MEVVDYGEPNRGESSLFTVNSPMKAAEYVILFSIVQGSDLAIHHFATSDSQYEQMLGRCNSKDVSPTKGMMISESDGRYVVQINVLEDVDGSIWYYEYSVTQDGKIENLEHKVIASCGYAI